MARDVHFFGGVGLVEAFEVGKANCFELIDGEGDMLEGREGDSPRFVVAALRQAADSSEARWSWHSLVACSLVVADVLSGLQLAREVVFDQLLGSFIWCADDDVDVVLCEELLRSLAHSAGYYGVDAEAGEPFRQ